MELIEVARLPVAGIPEETAEGYQTGMRLGQGVNWLVPSDHGLGTGATFDEWAKGLPVRLSPREREYARRAWEASVHRHTATLRHVGWLDQKGRVWTRTPTTQGFDGGSLTPLLIDARDGTGLAGE